MTRRITVIALPFALALIAIIFAGCKTDAASTSPEETAQPRQAKAEPKPSQETRTGIAVFLHQGLQGKATASGEVMDHDKLVAAHPSYPLGTTLRITNLDNDRQLEVRVIDRGPSESDQKKGVIIDLSRAAAEGLGFIDQGKARVRTEVIGWGTPGDGPR